MLICFRNGYYECNYYKIGIWVDIDLMYFYGKDGVFFMYFINLIIKCILIVEMLILYVYMYVLNIVIIKYVCIKMKVCVGCIFLGRIEFFLFIL